VTAESSYTTTDPCGSFTANVYEACQVGTWTQMATYDTLTDTTSVTVERGTTVRIELTPEDAQVIPGDLLTYTVTAYDALDNPLDVTAESSFTTTDPCGSFTANVYEACEVGVWTQTATYDMMVDSTSVTVGTQYFLPIILNNAMP
jgi:hypothetical protein